MPTQEEINRTQTHAGNEAARTYEITLDRHPGVVYKIEIENDYHSHNICNP
jgi:hypothetical protein